MKDTKKKATDQSSGENKSSLAVEEIVSPFKQIVRGFLERKLAVCALCFLICVFITVFVGPLFMPRYYDAYTESTQKDIAPGLNMMDVPDELKNDIKTIDGYGSFTVGLSNAGKVYIWGDSNNSVQGVDCADIPEAVQNAKIVAVAAGIDHVIAVDDTGRVYGWGGAKRGQYGYFTPEQELADDIVSMPEGLANGTQLLDPAHIAKVTCGYQVSAILMDDGQLYLWGNRKAYSNMDSFLDKSDLVDIDFTLNNIIGLTEARNTVFTGKRGLYDKFKPDLTSGTKAVVTSLFGIIPSVSFTYKY